MAYSIDYINQICIDLGGTGGHKYDIDALNEICGLLGATAGHDYEIHALNAICTALGYTAGWRYEIEALNAICTGGGGTGGHKYEIHAWQEIQTGSKLNLPFKEDLSFLSKSRSGLTLIDDYSNNATIIPSDITIPLCATNKININTGIVPLENTVWVFKGRFLTTAENYLGSKDGASYKYALSISWDAKWQIWFGGTLGKTGTADANPHVFILYNKKLWVRPITTELTDVSILNVINTVTATATSTGTWSATSIPLSIGFYIGNLEISDSYVGTITAGAITWQQKLIFNNPYYGFDILKTENNTIEITSVLADLKAVETAHTNGSSYFLDSGYPGTLGNSDKHNLANSFIKFPVGSIWDRSNTTVFEDAARATTTYYNASDPTVWHISELNNKVFSYFFKTDYKGRCFVKIADNSINPENRNLLSEVFVYNTNKTGSDFNKVLRYCGDYTYFYKTDFLQYPYTQVFKFTANEDSIFKFNINNSLIYTEADIVTKINAVVALIDRGTTYSKIYEFLENLIITNKQRAQYDNQISVIDAVNSYSEEICGRNSAVVGQVMRLLGSAYLGVLLTAHVSGQVAGTTYFDAGLKHLPYKGYYEHADLAEILADEYLFIEPLRSEGGSLAEAMFNHTWYAAHFPGASTYSQSLTVFADVKCQLPATSTFQLPVKSTVAPKSYDTSSLLEWANCIVTIPSGVVGIVEMPFSLSRITGTGTIKIGATTYDLTTDAAALATDILSYNAFRNKFEILTSGADIVAEYQFNRRNVLLYNDNTVTLEHTSGNVTYEVITTDKPLVTYDLMVIKGDADSWRVSWDKLLTKNMSIKMPVSITTSQDDRAVRFTKSGNKYPIRKYITNTLKNINKTIAAGVSVYDKCFAPFLYPRVNTFSTETLEISFVDYNPGGASIYYTVDGTTPDATKTLYTAPFTIAATTTIKAIAIKADYADSIVTSRVITKT